MTTVVYKNGCLAFDSRLVEDNICTGTIVKGRHTKNLLMAGCGACEDIVAVFDWLEAGGGEENKKKFGLAREVKCQVLTINKNGEVISYEGQLYPMKTNSPWYALGSGSDVALGALEMGATAKEAVQVASKYDVNTGGTVHTLSIKRLQQKVSSKKGKK